MPRLPETTAAKTPDDLFQCRVTIIGVYRVGINGWVRSRCIEGIPLREGDRIQKGLLQRVLRLVEGDIVPIEKHPQVKRLPGLIQDIGNPVDDGIRPNK